MLTCLHSDVVWMKNWQHLLQKSKVISLTMAYWGIPSRLLFNRVWRIQVGRLCIRSAPLALMDMNHAKGQWLFRRLEVHSIHSVIINSWYVLKNKKIVCFFPLCETTCGFKKKIKNQILYIQIQKFRVTTATSDSIFENQSELKLECLKIALELNSKNN